MCSVVVMLFTANVHLHMFICVGTRGEGHKRHVPPPKKKNSLLVPPLPSLRDSGMFSVFVLGTIILESAYCLPQQIKVTYQRAKPYHSQTLLFQ